MKVSADYRMLALDALRGKWKTAVLTGIAASALGATIVSSSNSAVSNSNQAKDIHFELFSQPNGGRLLAVLLAGIVLWAVLQLIVGGAVQLGYAHFNLNLVDGNDAAISDLFSQKDRLWDGFCMKFGGERAIEERYNTVNKGFLEAGLFEVTTFSIFIPLVDGLFFVALIVIFTTTNLIDSVADAGTVFAFIPEIVSSAPATAGRYGAAYIKAD